MWSVFKIKPFHQTHYPHELWLISTFNNYCFLKTLFTHLIVQSKDFLAIFPQPVMSAVLEFLWLCVLFLFFSLLHCLSGSDPLCCLFKMVDVAPLRQRTNVCSLAWACIPTNMNGHFSWWKASEGSRPCCCTRDSCWLVGGTQVLGDFWCWGHSWNCRLRCSLTLKILFPIHTHY